MLDEKQRIVTENYMFPIVSYTVNYKKMFNIFWLKLAPFLSKNHSVS